MCENSYWLKKGKVLTIDIVYWSFSTFQCSLSTIRWPQEGENSALVFFVPCGCHCTFVYHFLMSKLARINCLGQTIAGWQRTCTIMPSFESYLHWFLFSSEDFFLLPVFSVDRTSLLDQSFKVRILSFNEIICLLLVYSSIVLFFHYLGANYCFVFRD